MLYKHLYLRYGYLRNNSQLKGLIRMWSLSVCYNYCQGPENNYFELVHTVFIFFVNLKGRPYNRYISQSEWFNRFSDLMLIFRKYPDILQMNMFFPLFYDIFLRCKLLFLFVLVFSFVTKQIYTNLDKKYYFSTSLNK
jgi:hypothetical protein